MGYAYKHDGVWVEVSGAFTIGEGADGIQYPGDWPSLAKADERIAIGVCAIVEPDAPPTDVAVSGYELVGDDAPARVWTIEEPSLADLKAIYRARAEAVRDEKLNGGCETPSGRIDTDLESRLNVAGSVQMAGLMGAAFNVAWRRADNSYIQLSATAMAAVGLAAGQHVATCYAACFAIKDAISAATTREAVRAIDLTAGYPD